MKMPTPFQVEATAWLIICSGLLSVIGIETDWGQRWQYPVTMPDEPPSTFIAPSFSEPFTLAPADTLPETSMRPIFVVTRRPAPIPPPAEPPKPTMQRNQFVLTGTSITPQGSYAFLLEKAQNKSRVVALGKQINGIVVSEIRADRVTLTQYDDSEILLIVTAKGVQQQGGSGDGQRAPNTGSTPMRRQLQRPNPDAPQGPQPSQPVQDNSAEQLL